MSPNARGSLFMVLAMIGFGIEDAFFKAATATGGVSAGMATLQFGLLALLATAVHARTKGVALFTPSYFKRGLLIRTAFEICGRLFFALALAYTPLSTTSAILQAAPLVVMLGAALVLGEHIGPRRWAAVALGFVGVLMIIRPTPSGFDASAIFALLGMIGFAGRDLATRTSPPDMHPAQLGILGFGVVSFAGIVIMAFEPGAPSLPSPFAALLLCGTAACGVLAYNALTTAMRSGEVGVVAPFRYSRLIVALILAFVLFGERPDALTLGGAALIVGSGLYSLWRQGLDQKARSH
jgi:drug/metabolite transporter (DMT)-like permease